VAVLGACTAGPRPEEPAERDPAGVAAAAFLAAWAEEDLAAAAGLTDEPTAARQGLSEAMETLRVRSARFDPGAPTAAEATASPFPPPGAWTVPFRATLTLATLGDWTYDGRLRVVERDGRWLVDWSPDTVHPALSAGTRLARVRELPPRAPILDRRGRPLTRERPVVEIGVEPRRLSQPARAYRVAAGLPDVDVALLRARVDAARPDELVPVITLRREVFADVEREIRDTPGFVVVEGTATLAPTRDFGRALLGRVRPASAQTLADAGPLASEVDDIGASGLQRAFEERLAGEPAGAVRVIDRRPGRGVVETLHEFPGRRGIPLPTTLDLDAQTAAEAALGGRAGAIVAVRPSTGDVLAAASGPADDGQERALAGRYPPGSTFKVVTAAELLAGGLAPDQTVPCPPRAVVDGKRFTNQDGFALGAVPFRTDFARSCNTAFVALSGGLAPDALSRRARDFGLGVTHDLGVPSYAGQVPPEADPVRRAATAIGQGEVLASPLAMAGVAGTVAAGGWHPPRLLPKLTAAGRVSRLDPDVARTLRELMRAVVTEGSARALAGLPGQPVAAKTGTAEFGERRPPRTHAWMIGYRGDLAFAVLLEGGGSGGRDAGPVARTFLEELAGFPG
jgi:cell division protein FtsI/penicillin-binding protein 2